MDNEIVTTLQRPSGVWLVDAEHVINGGVVVLVPSLTQWGLPPEADLLYRTLVCSGSSSASGLARDLGMSRQRIQRALAILDDADAVTVMGVEPTRRWEAKPVSTVLRRLQKVRISPLPKPPMAKEVPFGPSDHFELGVGVTHLSTRSATRQRLAHLTGVLRRELLTMNPERAFEPAAIAGSVQPTNTLLTRGASIRELGVQQAELEMLVPYGGHPQQRSAYRQAADVPMKLFIVDRIIALFPVDPSNYERGYLEISQPPVVASLHATFEQQWQAARESQETLMPAIVLSEREDAVVKLLVAGLTDLGVARQLRISERTVSGIVRSLMDRLGVTNRFQLGVALGTMRAVSLPANS